MIRTRRVTRNMSAEPVDPERFELVLRSARYAPNAGNRRLQPVVPVTDPGLLRLLRMVAPGMIVPSVTRPGTSHRRSARRWIDRDPAARAAGVLQSPRDRGRVVLGGPPGPPLRPAL